MPPKAASASTLHIALLYVLAGAVRYTPSAPLPERVICLCPNAGQHLPPPGSLATSLPSSGRLTANNLVGFFHGVPQQHWSRWTHSVPPALASSFNSGRFHEEGASGIQPGSCGCSITAEKPYTRAAARNSITVRMRAFPSATCCLSAASDQASPTGAGKT